MLLTVPVDLSHFSPPLQPPSMQELGPGLLPLKSQLRRPFKIQRSQKLTHDDR